MTARGALVFLSLTLLTGCPEKGKGTSGTADVGSAVPMTGRIKKPTGTAPIVPPTTTPGDDGPFSKSAIAELYKSYALGDKTLAAQKKYGLVDDKGEEVPARVAAYDEALKKFAEAHGDELSALADEIEAARVTSSASPGVGGK